MAQMKLMNPDDVAVQLTLAYHLKDWKRIQHGIAVSVVRYEDTPLRDLMAQISEAIAKFEQTVIS